MAMKGLPRFTDDDIALIGRGRFSVTDLDESYVVQIHRDSSLSCTCRAGQCKVRCAHQTAVLTYCTQFNHLPEQADIPSPIDVAQIEEEALTAYIIKLNRAHNVLAVQKTQALIPLAAQTKEFKRRRSRLRQMKLLKAPAETLIEEMKALDEAEALRDDAQLVLDILAVKMDDVQTATMRAQSVLKTLRP
jgi:hypothetical protein